MFPSALLVSRACSYVLSLPRALSTRSHLCPHVPRCARQQQTTFSFTEFLGQASFVASKSIRKGSKDAANLQQPALTRPICLTCSRTFGTSELSSSQNVALQSVQPAVTAFLSFLHPAETPYWGPASASLTSSLVSSGVSCWQDHSSVDRKHVTEINKDPQELHSRRQEHRHATDSKWRPQLGDPRI